MTAERFAEPALPTDSRNWIIPFWNLPVRWVFASLPFGLLITLLFYFDVRAPRSPLFTALTDLARSQNNVSAVMAQARSFPVKRPAGFHWDFFLLGITTFVAGILGLPAPNGLVPQAPVHTEALCVTKMVPEETVLSEGGFYDGEVDQRRSEEQESKASGRQKVVRTRLVEQRVSHLVMGVSRSLSSSFELSFDLFTLRSSSLSAPCRVLCSSFCESRSPPAPTLLTDPLPVRQRSHVESHVCRNLYRRRLGLGRRERHRSQDPIPSARSPSHAARSPAIRCAQVVHFEVHQHPVALLCHDHRDFRDAR